MRKTRFPWLRRVVPSPEALRQVRGFGWLAPVLERRELWHLNRRSVALGLAVGVFFSALIPVGQSVAAAAAAFVLRANLPMAVLVTLLSNPLTLPLIYLAAFHTGQTLLGGTAAIDSADFGLHVFSEVGKPLAFGLALLAAGGAVCTYAAVQLSWRSAVVLQLARRSATRAARARAQQLP